jgi:hypothetical protein
MPAAAHGPRVSVGFYGGWGGGWYGPGWWGGWYGPWYGPGPYAPAVYGAVPIDVGVVDTDISPEHARVFLDGEMIGTADEFDGYPSYLFLKLGRYTLEFKLGGYAPASLSLDVAEGRFFPLDLKLERIKGEKATPGSDRPKPGPAGRVFGPVPAGAAAQAAASGPDLSLRPDLRVERDSGAPAAARSGAALEVKVTPPVASVYVDGEFVGTGSELARLQRGLSVAPGAHRIEVMAPGHEPREVAVEVPAGERRQVVVELEEKPSARAGQTS